MGAWVHPALSTSRLDDLRLWALRAAEQSREYGEGEEVWGPYLGTADRVSDLLDQRAQCGPASVYSGCAVLKMRSPEDERTRRNGCFYPLCLIPAGSNMPTGRIQFHYDTQER